MNQYDKIPQALQSIPHWLTWYYNPKANGKMEKVPNVVTGKWDNKNLYTFSEALSEYDRYHQSEILTMLPKILFRMQSVLSLPQPKKLGDI